jgi:L-ascorbate metabolism protein UlaG (beta-lactamase superfamily)
MISKVLGRLPAGKDLERIQDSVNYHDGSFRNLSPTKLIREKTSSFKLFRDFINKPASTQPSAVLPSLRTDLKTLDTGKPVLIWFGHSSYLVRYQQINILVDPVLSGSISPISRFGRAFRGTDIYSVDDLPEIDVLILTHDHYDHLDYKTIRALSNRVKQFYVSLGIESHLKYWGIDPAKINSLDWWKSRLLPEGFKLTAAPARHFSGRGFTRNKTLWSSFILEMDEYSIYIGGDSGYDTHFKEIAERFVSFDLAILECGQYNQLWPDIHLTPEQTIAAAEDLGAKLLLPVHWGKFALAYHDWDEPIKRLLKAASGKNIGVCTPMIGQALILGDNYPCESWWT